MAADPVHPHPALHLHIATPGEGIWPSPIVQFDQSGSKILVQYHAPRTSFSIWWNTHSIDICGVASLILLIYLAVVLIRTMRRVQVVGRFYCRNCNYEIAPQTHYAGDRCPECGTSLVSRRPVAGRPRIWRPIAKLALLVPLLVGALYIWQGKIERRSATNRIWPLESLRAISWWPLATPIVPIQRCAVLDTYSIPDFKRRTHMKVDIEQWLGGISTDLNHFTRVQITTGQSPRILAALYDVSRDRVDLVDLADASRNTAKFQEFSGDGASAIYTIVTNPSVDSPCSVSICSINLDTHVKRELVRIDTIAAIVDSSPNRARVPGSLSARAPTMFAACGGNPEQWSLLIADGPQQGKLLFAPTASKGTPSTIQLDPDPRISNTSSIAFIDGTTLRLNNSILPLLDITLPEGAISRNVPKPPFTIQFRNGNLEIMRDYKVVRSFAVDPAIAYSTGYAAFSADGRYLAYPCILYGNGNVVKSEVILIDLNIPDNQLPPAAK